jgi:hypothetical protein
MYKSRPLMSCGILLLSIFSLGYPLLCTEVGINAKLGSVFIEILPSRGVIIWCHRSLRVVVSTFGVKVIISRSATPGAAKVGCFERSCSCSCSTGHCPRSTHLLTLEPCLNLVRSGGDTHHPRPLPTTLILEVNLSLAVLNSSDEFAATAHI